MKNLKFSALVRLYENEVYTLALYLLKDRNEAEDMTQEAYIKLWENLAQVDIARAKFWLLRVTRNACLDRLRRRVLERDFLSQTETEEPARGPVDILTGEQRAGMLREALGRLEEPYKSLVILRDIHDHSYTDIARILELSLDQVRVYLYRARQRLKVILDTSDV